MFPFHRTSWRQNIAIDVGTATIRIAAGPSRVVEQPSCIGTKRALCGGVVVDGETAVHILKPLLDRTRVFGVVKPCVLACTPSDVRKEERQLLVDSIVAAGAASVSVIPEPLAAAVGAGIDVSSPYAHMVVDIGEGVTDCAIIQAARIRATCAIRVGCGRMRRHIVMAAKENGYVSVRDTDGDMLLRTWGLVPPVGQEATVPGSALVAAAIKPVLAQIAGTVDCFLRGQPPLLGCEVIDSGICLAGGGSLIPGVREYIERRTGISVRIAQNPRAAVVEGARAILPVIQALNNWE